MLKSKCLLVWVMGEKDKEKTMAGGEVRGRDGWCYYTSAIPGLTKPLWKPGYLSTQGMGERWTGGGGGRGRCEN